MAMTMDGRTSASISTLCLFGADVGCRLVQLAKGVDGMPSVVKSLGYEIWAVCEVLYVFIRLCRALNNQGTMRKWD
jgi:hypothetical protein